VENQEGGHIQLSRGSRRFFRPRITRIDANQRKAAPPLRRGAVSTGSRPRASRGGTPKLNRIHLSQTSNFAGCETAVPCIFLFAFIRVIRGLNFGLARRSLGEGGLRRSRSGESAVKFCACYAIQRISAISRLRLLTSSLRKIA
jgi:hypothetical protein